MNNRMPMVVPSLAPQSEPQNGLGVGKGPVHPSVGDLIDDLHNALQKAVVDYGGVTALAEAMGKSTSDVSLRVRRAEDSKKQVQKASLDLLAHVAADPKARHTFVACLLAAWGYKAPELAREPSSEEKLNALLLTLKGDAGEAILERAAELSGFDVKSFRR